MANFTRSFLILLSGTCIWASCVENISTNFFSTEDAVKLSKIAHIAVIEFKCDIKQELFAEFPDGKIVSLAHVNDNKFQVNWIEDIKTSSSGNVVLRIFDEEGFGTIRKAQRDGDKVSNVKSLIDITMETKRAYKGPWMRAELFSAVFIGAIAYYALNTKSKMQA